MFTTKDPAISQLPAHVLAALERGRTVEAIKLLREATGLGLKEAKDAIDGRVRGEPIARAPRGSSLESLPPEVLAALRQGKKLEAVRLMRTKTGMGLKEAKDAVERLHNPEAFGVADQLSPGEVPKSGGGGWAVWLLLALAGLGYYFFTRSG